MAEAKVAIGSRWKTTDGRVFVVVEKRPFGGVEIEQEDRRSYSGSTTQRNLLANFSRVGGGVKS